MQLSNFIASAEHYTKDFTSTKYNNLHIYIFGAPQMNDLFIFFPKLLLLESLICCQH